MRAFHAAVATIAQLELGELGRRVVYPYRVPLDNVATARLARAAAELQEAARELELAGLRRLNRKGPKRVESARKGESDVARRNSRGR